MTSKVKCEYISGKDNMVQFFKRGKLTVQDIRDKAREMDLGTIAIVLRCDQDYSCGFYDEDDDISKMDHQDAFILYEDDTCPAVSPIRMWCPECGSRLKEEEK